MITHDSVLVQLILLIERIPSPPPPLRRRRGRPIFYSEKLFMKALVIMIVRRLHRVGELLAVLEEPTPEMMIVRELLSEEGRFPTRRTFQRRLKALPERLPEQIGCLGRHLVEVLNPWESRGRAVALDSTALQAKGGVWHKKDREAGIVPPIPQLIPRLAGPTPVGTGGFMDGSCTWPLRWAGCGSRSQPASPRPM